MDSKLVTVTVGSAATLGAALLVLRSARITAKARPRVLVSGFWDLLHAGHVKFLEQAAVLGDVYACVGNDANFRALRGVSPVYSEQERLYMISQLSSVTEAWVTAGTGPLDMECDLDRIKPDIYFTSVGDGGDGDSTAADKQVMCDSRGIVFNAKLRTAMVAGQKVDQTASSIKTRIQSAFTSASQPLEAIGTLETEDLHAFPWRVCLAGGWLDQPWVSSISPGSTIVVNVKAHPKFKTCLLYTSDAADEEDSVDLGGRRFI
eukprot:TRINITY_DN44928_c0_g1_i2.p1 TRINITY_DN44928_c0_g1~~TRINITY_DN44928_c0_g1_i2.p1  ORF type:complete len:262 (+),score=51.25 TRINITY_DN44928_c0_g1_i2:175-960(+)